MEKVIIIGSGPAGLTAAIYTARAFLNPIVISGPNPGGQLLFTTTIENYPGFEDGILGYELMAKMKQQAEKFGTKFIEETVKSVNFSQTPFTITTDNQKLTAESVIISTGARWKMLGLENEQKFLGKGIHTCAVCDGAFYKNKEIIVVGGGDSAMEEATFLSRFANKVTIVYINGELSASKSMQGKARKDHKIAFISNSVVKKYFGSDKLEAIEIFNQKTNESNVLKIDGLFLAIGQIPNTEMFKGQLNLNKNGYIEPKNNVFTEINGVFVAGDAADYYYRQAITAAGFGCMAALEAEKFLNL